MECRCRQHNPIQKTRFTLRQQHRKKTDDKLQKHASNSNKVEGFSHTHTFKKKKKRKKKQQKLIKQTDEQTQQSDTLGK